MCMPRTCMCDRMRNLNRLEHDAQMCVRAQEWDDPEDDTPHAHVHLHETMAGDTAVWSTHEAHVHDATVRYMHTCDACD